MDDEQAGSAGDGCDRRGVADEIVFEIVIERRVPGVDRVASSNV